MSQSQSMFVLISVFRTAEPPNHCSAVSESRCGCWWWIGSQKEVDAEAEIHLQAHVCFKRLMHHHWKWWHHAFRRTNTSSSTWFYRPELFWLTSRNRLHHPDNQFNSRIIQYLFPTDRGCKINPETSWWKVELGLKIIIMSKSFPFELSAGQ